jgi:hypothetical protein
MQGCPVRAYMRLTWFLIVCVCLTACVGTWGLGAWAAAYGPCWYMPAAPCGIPLCSSRHQHHRKKKGMADVLDGLHSATEAVQIKKV